MDITLTAAIGWRLTMMPYSVNKFFRFLSGFSRIGPLPKEIGI
jgi:hypothetical protein